MDILATTIKTNASNGLIDEKLSKKILDSLNQYQDALMSYDGKDKDAVLAKGCYKRENLIDSMFSLKEVCENMFCAIDEVLNTGGLGVSMTDKFSKMLEASLNKITDKMISKVSNASVSDEKLPVAVGQCCTNTEKHVVILEDKDDEANGFSVSTWNEVVKKKLSKSLKNVPIEKSVLSKQGKGCLILPTKDAQQKAKIALENDFCVSVESKPKKNILPKMKVYNIDTNYYRDKVTLRQVILEKNDVINNLVENGKVFDIIYIDTKRNSATIKCSPDIRTAVNQASGKIYLDMQVHHIKDHFQPLQCYACQCYGHKQGSPECAIEHGKNVCLYCSGNHRSKDCLSKDQKRSYKCLNCTNSTNPAHRADSCHTSNSVTCPYFIKETNSLIRRTAGLNDAEVKKFLINQVS